MDRELDGALPPVSVNTEQLLNERFRIRKKIGEGGFGVTYLGYDEQSGSRCVIKELSLRKVEEWKTVELFEREARVLKNLRHPRIPGFIEFFSVPVDGETRAYLVQEFIEGRNLADLVREGKHFSEREVIDIALQVGEILEYLHSLSPPIIHRDIKPSNILLDDGGRAYLIDFGAVRDKILHMQKTEAGGFTVIGTYGYMPFEQFQGRALPASDIYSLGVAMIAILSHKEPHEMEHLGDRLEFESHVMVSENLKLVLRKMVEPQLEKRYLSVVDLKNDLENTLEGKQVVLPQKTAWSWPSLVIVLAGAAFLFLGGWFIVRQDQKPEVMTIPIPKQVEPAPPGEGYLVRGRVLYDGDSVTRLNPPHPRFWFRNEGTGRVHSADPVYREGMIAVKMPEGQFGMNVYFDLNPQNPLNYPGDLYSWLTFGVPKSRVNLVVEMKKVIHLIKPQDNGIEMAGWGLDARGMPAFSAPVQFRWDSLGKNVFYDYSFSRIEAPYKTLDSVKSGTTTETRVIFDAPASEENQFYLLNLTARKNGRQIGLLMTHGANGLGWDYRFRVK